MQQQIIEITSGYPQELVVFLMSMMPVIELRAAIPVGIALGLEPWTTFTYAIIGNILITIPLVYLYPVIARFLSSKSFRCDRFFKWLDAKTRHKHSRSFDRYGALALVLFVSVPLPGTGAWSGSVASYIFGIRPRNAVFLISTGVIIAGLLITFGTGGVIWLYQNYITI